MNFPSELKYTKSHEWIKEEDGKFLVGLTEFAQDQMGGIVFVDLPEEEDEFSEGESFAEAESVKAVSEIFSPIEGSVVEVNEELEDEPQLINEKPYEAWIAKFEGELVAEVLDAEAYKKFCETEA